MHSHLGLGLVKGFSYPGGQNRRTVVGGHLLVGRVNVGLVAASLASPGLEVVDHHQLRFRFGIGDLSAFSNGVCSCGRTSVIAYQLVVNRQGHNDVMTLVCDFQESPAELDQLKANM
ncbi:hypothetical protein DFAR_220013 [Desulfarculales bacterium]